MRTRRSALIVAILTLLPALWFGNHLMVRVSGQSSTAPQQIQASPQALNNCTPTHTDAAINTLVTITLTPPNGQFVYLCGWEYTVTNDATGTGPAFVTNKWTVSNMPGAAPTTLTSVFSLPLTANIQIDQRYQYAIPIKSAQQGVAVVMSSPAINAHAAYSGTMWYYFNL